MRRKLPSPPLRRSEGDPTAWPSTIETASAGVIPVQALLVTGLGYGGLVLLEVLMHHYQISRLPCAASSLEECIRGPSRGRSPSLRVPYRQELPDTRTMHWTI